MEARLLRLVLAGPILAVCATSSPMTASSAQEPGADAACPAPHGRGDGAGAAVGGAAPALAAHNRERARLGLPAFTWSCRLEGEAAQWAETLARRGALEHAGNAARRGSGENLWMGTAGRFQVEQMVGRFIEEGRHYRHGRFPDISLTGNWTDAGHYTQVVWRDTRELGCALARGAAHDVLVCRYRPAGNVTGRVAY